MDHLIPPEITDDRLYAAIARVAATPGVREMLEIGSSAGAGSTEAFVAGALANPVRPQLHCVEVSAKRHAALATRYAGHSFVHCYCVSSVDLDGFAPAAEVAHFYTNVDSKLRRFSLQQVQGWLEQDVNYVSARGVPTNGIQLIKSQSGVQCFDAVLIDGSEFTGQAELRSIYGARFILLDDICTFKNYANFRELAQDPSYQLLESASEPRNGYALFERVSVT